MIFASAAVALTAFCTHTLGVFDSWLANDRVSTDFQTASVFSSAKVSLTLSCLDTLTVSAIQISVLNYILGWEEQGFHSP